MFVGLCITDSKLLSGSKVHQLHCLEEQGDRRLQDRGPRGLGQAVGHPEEPPVHELRQDVEGAPILLQSQHSAESARGAALLPVSFKT
jgi:hypothetical protein